MADYQKTFNLTLPAAPGLTDAGCQGVIEGDGALVVAVPPTLTEEALTVTPNTDPTGVLLYDYGLGTYTDYLAEAIEDTADDVPFPIDMQDILYIGGASKFYIVQVDLTTAGIGTYTINYEYWNGSGWAALPKAQGDDGNFKTAEVSRVVWFTDLPANWVENSVDGSTRHWVRFYRWSGTQTQQPLARRIKLSYTAVTVFMTATAAASASTTGSLTVGKTEQMTATAAASASATAALTMGKTEQMTATAAASSSASASLTVRTYKFISFTSENIYQPFF